MVFQYFNFMHEGALTSVYFGLIFYDASNLNGYSTDSHTTG